MAPPQPARPRTVGHLAVRVTEQAREASESLPKDRRVTRIVTPLRAIAAFRRAEVRREIGHFPAVSLDIL